MSNNANLYFNFVKKFPDDLSSTLIQNLDGSKITYSEVISRSAKFSNTLIRLGAVKGDRISVQVEKSIDNLCLYLACLRSGFVYHPLNTAYKSSELSYFINDADPVIVICKQEILSVFESLIQTSNVKALLTLDSVSKGTLIDESIDASDKAEIVFSLGSDKAALLYSSGTTGQPKGIILSHANLLSNAKLLVEAWGFSPSDQLLHALPLYHIHGLFVALNCVLLSGASMLWHESFNEQPIIESMKDCTVMMGVPTYYTRLLENSNLTSNNCLNMRLFISGSAPLLAETFVEFHARTGHTILERYGMTETGINTSNPLKEERRVGTVGKPLPGVSVRIVNDEGELIKVNEKGNLQLKGSNVFSGYWKMPEKTIEDFTQDGFFNTGDLASIDGDGYISIVGRSKDMIITGGLNVYPKEIELIIDGLDGVLESAVIGVPDDDFGERVIAILVVKDLSMTEKEVINFCKEKLAGFKVPKAVKFVKSLPRNAMGKVQKNLIRGEWA
jgi:malonyl-CoA/methylmalonyl-CoA synthetase